MSKLSLKIMSIFLILFISAECFQHSNFCGNAKYEKKIELTKLEIETSETRVLQDAVYESIRIHVDYTHFDSQASSLSQEVITGYKEVISKSVEVYHKLLKVKRMSSLLKVNSCSGLSISSEVSSTGVDADLIIFPYIDLEIQGTNIIAYAGPCIISSVNNRPLAGIIAFNKDFLNFSFTNALHYLTMTGLHEINHILVFNSSLYDLFIDSSGNRIPFSEVVQTFSKRGKEVAMIVLPKVKEAARKHFNCPELEGLEIEDQGGDGTAGSHWEARTMFGDFMIGISETEQVFSDMTLALLEDSGWYEVNYYTGGLFNYGKNRGCSFINEKCIVNGESKFKNEFPITSGSADTCYAGRTSRGKSIFSRFNSIDPFFQYFSDPNIGGYPLADFCPVPYSYQASNFYDSGSCISGTTSLPQELGESISAHSYCFYSSLVPSNDDSLSNYIDNTRPTCHEVTCDYNTKTYSVKIGDKTASCGTVGEIVTVTDFVGSFECVDFIIICSKTVECSDAIDCILKQSLSITTPDCESNNYLNRITNACVTSDQCPDDTYGEDIYKSCVDLASCPSSQPYGDNVTKKCVSTANCSDGYFADNIKSICVLPSDCDISTPYGDPVTKICVKLSDCDSNNPWGNPTTNLCTTLKECSDINLYADPKTNTCVQASECPTEYPYADPFTYQCTDSCSAINPFGDPTTKMCVTDSNCDSDNPNIDPFEKICVFECSLEYCLKGNYCWSCDDTCPPNLFKYQDECVETCPFENQVDNENKLCYDCGSIQSFFHINKCETECPEYYAPDPSNNSTCIKCPAINLIWYQKQCINQAPSGTVEISSEYGAYVTCKEANMYLFNDECVDACQKPYFTDIDNNCVYSWYEDGKYLFNETIVDECPNGYLSNDDRICYSCKSLNKYYLDSKCFDSCPEFYIIGENNICITCQSLNKYFFDGTCVDECPNGATNLDSICECSDGKKYYPDEYSCVDECPPGIGYISRENKCVSCQTMNMYYYKDECVNICPLGTLNDDSTFTCVATTVIIPGSNDDILTSCDPNPCKNSGVCLEQGNIISCQCPENYFGETCEYTEFEIKESSKNFESYFTNLTEKSDVNISNLNNDIKTFKNFVTQFPQERNPEVVSTLTNFLSKENLSNIFNSSSNYI